MIQTQLHVTMFCSGRERLKLIGAFLKQRSSVILLYGRNFCCHSNLHACAVSHFHADDLEFHFPHATDRNTVTSGCKQQHLFLQVQ